MITLAHILSYLTNSYPAGQSSPSITKAVTDSRDAIPGSLFVAIEGENVDGHNYIQAAFDNGAIVALASRPVTGDHATIDLRLDVMPEIRPGKKHIIVTADSVKSAQIIAQAWRDQFDIKIIGVTGSVGKTSTKELVHAVLSSRYNTYKSPGNKNSILGLPPALMSLGAEHERAILEMAMYEPGEIAKLCEITRPEIGIVTMIDAVHMSRAGSLENIVIAKRELIESLPAHGTAILNYDEPLVMGMADHTQARVFTYGLDSEADVWADQIESLGLQGIRFTLHSGRDQLRVQVPLLGRHSVHTALRAAAVGLVEGLTWAEIVRGLQGTPTQLRIVTADGPRNSLIVDDTYNASPASMIAALNLLADLGGRRVAVLGDMLELGSAEESSHRLVGRRARAVAQVLVTIGRRGRMIGRSAKADGHQAVHITDEADQAISLLADLIEPNDVILVKGSRAVGMDRVVSALSRMAQGDL